MIETRRLVLRPARPDDLAPLHRLLSDPRAMRFWERPPHTDIAETQRFLDAMIGQNPDQSLDLIVEREGTCIGKAGLWRKPEIGYILHPDHWGQGLATEALAALIPAIFARFPTLTRLIAEADARNAASARVLGKLGFRQIGFAAQNFLYGDVDWCDTAYFALDAAVWRARAPLLLGTNTPGES